MHGILIQIAIIIPIQKFGLIVQFNSGIGNQIQSTIFIIEINSKIPAIDRNFSHCF
ncbi:MAG: hypothetical protein ACTSPY_16465 [Candidatus Helarchaeota archaeon]